MTTSAECHYQPRVQAEFDVDSEQLDQLGDCLIRTHFPKWVCSNLSASFLLQMSTMPFRSATSTNPFMCLHSQQQTRLTGWQTSRNTLVGLPCFTPHPSPLHPSPSPLHPSPLHPSPSGRVSATTEQQKQQFMARAVWVPDSSCRSCMVCGTRFTAFSRKHHCRRCGRIVCGSCSPHRCTTLPTLPTLTAVSVCRLDISEGFTGGKLERVCNDCFREMSKTTVQVQWQTGGWVLNRNSFIAKVRSLQPPLSATCRAPLPRP